MTRVTSKAAPKTLEDRAREFRDKLEGFIVQYNGGTPPQINDGALAVIQWELRQVAREERERCAKVCDKMLEQEGNNSEVHKRRCHAVDAAAIRSLRDVL